MCTGQVIKQSGKGSAVVCKVFRTGLQKLDLSFQPQKQCVYIFMNGMEFFSGADPCGNEFYELCD